MQIKAETTMEAPEEISLDCLKNTVLFSCKVSRWGNKAKCRDPRKIEQYYAMQNGRNTGMVETSGPETTANPRRVSTSKVLVRSKALDELCEQMRLLKKQALGFAMPSFIRGGSYVVKRDRIEALVQMIDAGKARIASDYLPLFEEDYPEAIKRSRANPVVPTDEQTKLGITPGLGPLFDEKDYPPIELLRKKFKVTYNFFALTVPEGLPPGVRQEEERKLRQAYAESVQAMRDALREMFAKLIENAVDKLSPKPGEKPKRFNDTLVSNLTEFFETFEARNITNDEQLKELVEKCKAVLTGVSTDRLRSDFDFKTQTGEALGKIKEALEPMIEEIEERAFDFSND